MARRATIIREERKRAGHVLVLDAGNSLLNDRAPAKTTRGRSSIEALNLMGYDALSLGTLDLSLLGLEEIHQRLDESRFPLLSANAYVSGTQDLLANPYVVIRVADHRVGILGLTDAGSTAQVEVADALAAAKQWLPELQRMADIVIVLSHAGLSVDRAIAEQVSGIDVIVSGGNQYLDQPAIAQRTGTLILHAEAPSAGLAGRNVGVAQLSFDKGGRLLKHAWKRVVLTPDVAEDAQLKAWLDTAPKP